MNPLPIDTTSMASIPDLLLQLRQIIRPADRPDVRSVPELLNRMLGNRNATTMCLRLLYWFPRATRVGGWVYKSWRDWQAECNLSQGQVKRVHGKGCLETIGIIRKTMKANGTPTSHYRLDLNRFVLCIAQYLDLPVDQILGWTEDQGRCHTLSQLAGTTSSDGLKQPYGNVQNDPSQLAETTQSITITTKQHYQHQDYQDNKQQGPDVVVNDSYSVDCNAAGEIQKEIKALGIQPGKAQQLILEYGTRRVRAVLAHARQQTIYNPAGFIIRALEQDWQIRESHEYRINDELEDGMGYVRGKYAEFIDF